MTACEAATTYMHMFISEEKKKNLQHFFHSPKKKKSALKLNWNDISKEINNEIKRENRIRPTTYMHTAVITGF